MDAPLPRYAGDGSFAVVWRRFEGCSHRLRLRTVDRRGRISPTTRLTGGGESAYYPAWADGPGAALQWTRRTRADGAELTADGLRRLRLPAAPLSDPGAAPGLTTISWVDEERVLVSDRDADGYSAPLTLATGEVNLTRTVRVRGATLVLWREDTNLMVAARPADGAPFGPPRQLLASTTDAAQVAVTRTGELFVVAPVGDSSQVGDLRLVRVAADGVALAPSRSLGRGRLARLVADGTGSSFVAWTGTDSTRAITARRIAAGGILGRPMKLGSRSDLGSRVALAATREG
ncbi:MAG: hypothetical protein H0V81_12825, partial [Solirubrobacterales bacterium]|nr:hypothetical protein [Solirubrobacterales bacterium]